MWTIRRQRGVRLVRTVALLICCSDGCADGGFFFQRYEYSLEAQ
jgi:hypothetical protein